MMSNFQRKTAGHGSTDLGPVFLRINVCFREECCSRKLIKMFRVLSAATASRIISYAKLSAEWRQMWNSKWCQAAPSPWLLIQPCSSQISGCSPWPTRSHTSSWQLTHCRVWQYELSPLWLGCLHHFSLFSFEAGKRQDADKVLFKLFKCSKRLNLFLSLPRDRVEKIN